jgi:hypothetical protein
VSSQGEPAKGLTEPLLGLATQRTEWKLGQKFGALALATLQDREVIRVVLQISQEAIELPLQPMPALGQAGAQTTDALAAQE